MSQSLLILSSCVFAFIAIFGDEAFDRNIYINKAFQVFFMVFSLILMRHA